jgi:hypothetical protein
MNRYHAETIIGFIVVVLLGVVSVDCFRRGQYVGGLPLLLGAAIRGLRNHLQGTTSA